MEESAVRLSSEPERSFNSRRKRQLLMLVICTAIATVLWFLRALENNYTTDIEKPLQVNGLPEDLFLRDPVPDKLFLRVEGHGYSILRHNLKFSKTPLVISFNEIQSALPHTRMTEFSEMVPTNRYLGPFKSQISDLTVVAIKPDTLTFHFGRFEKNTVTPVAAVKPVNENINSSKVLTSGL